MTEKYWIKKGIQVKHPDIGPSLTVEKILYKSVVTKDGETKKYTIGVKCHWIVAGAYHTGVFHTKELSPVNDNSTT